MYTRICLLHVFENMEILDIEVFKVLFPILYFPFVLSSFTFSEKLSIMLFPQIG